MKIQGPLKKLLCIVMCCALLVCALPELGMDTAHAAGSGIVRVRIATASDVSKVVLLSRGNFSVEGDPARPFTSGQKATVFAEGGQLHITIEDKTYDMGSSFKLIRHAPDSVSNALSFSSPSLTRYFPGDMEFRLVSGKIQTVNHVFIEDYLRGVLAAEWSEGHTLESQKAMAVMARTKARHCMASPKGSYYDIRNTSADQNYKGVVPSQSVTARAVSETEGVVIRYKGSLTDGVYGASNGGQIESSANRWGGSQLPYSTVKDDPYDYKNPKSPVKRLTVYSDMAGNLSKKGMTALNKLLLAEVEDELSPSQYQPDSAKIVSINAIEPHTPKYSSPSRMYQKMRFVLTVSAVTTEGETITIPGDVEVNLDIFSQLDNSTFGLSHQSSHNELFTVVKDDSNFVIESRRWGHGVGYSQYGAEQMSKEGYGWREILDFYHNSKVSYPTEKFSRPKLTELGDAVPPEVTPKPTALPECELFPQPLKAVVKVSSTLNMRVEPMSGAQVLTTLRNGDEVAAIGVIGDWTFAEFGEYVGYVSTRYLNMTDIPMATSDPGVTHEPTTPPMPTSTPITVPDEGKYMQVICSTYVNLRSGPGTGYDAIARLHNGDLVKLLGLSGTWSHVYYNGLEGYVSSSLLTSVETATAVPSDQPTPTPTPTPAPTPTAGAERAAVVNCSGSLNVRSAPSTGASKVGMLKRGDKITVLAEENGWAKIKYKDGVAYVNAAYIRYVDAPTGQPTTTPTPTATDGAGRAAVVNCSSSLNVRSAPSTGASKVGMLKRGDNITVLAEENGWAKIKYKDGVAYVNAAYIRYVDAPTDEPTGAPTGVPTARPTSDPGGQVPGDTATLVCGGSMNIRQLPTTASSSLGIVRDGATVTVHSIGNGVDGDWANITYAGKTGYVKTKYLDFGSAPAPTKVPEATAQPKPPQDNDYQPGITNKGRVTATELNIRRTASTSAEIVYELKRGDEVDIVDITADGKWFYVVYGEYEGYCSRQYIQPFVSANSLIKPTGQPELPTAEPAAELPSPAPGASQDADEAGETELPGTEGAADGGMAA
ncbi:MAG: SH3 domain-containing protein [Candidatus Fimadaptatus sp.]|jgi:SpoIID/LytB domain protein